MKALAIDCAVSKIAIAAKNDGNVVQLTYDIGIKQSEKLLPAIDFVMRELQLSASQLDYTCLTLGPGTFTGLRLGLSTLKAINLAFGVPVYGIPSLEAYAYPYAAVENVLSLIEAKEDEFFFQFFSKGRPLTEVEDRAFDDIAGRLSSERPTVVAGPAASVFTEHVRESFPLLKLESFDRGNSCAESLFELAERKISLGEGPLEDYDGPLYVRKSEAELVLEAKKTPR